MSLAPSVAAAIEAIPSQGTEQQPQHVGPPPSQLASQPLPSLLASVTPPSQPAPALSALTAAIAVTSPIPSMTNVVAPPIQPAASTTSVCAISSNLPELNIKQEAEPMDSSKPGGIFCISCQAYCGNQNWSDL